MKRIGIVTASAFLGLIATGCDGGLKEGPPPDAAKGSMTTDHKSFMEKNANKMQMPKGRPKDVPKATPAPAEDAPAPK